MGEFSRSGRSGVPSATRGDAGGRFELADGSALGAETARRLLCDAAIESSAEGGDDPVSPGTRSRTISSSIRRALRARDEGCRFPGCTHHRFVDAHHIHHWADGGKTSVDNLVQLCRRHHRLIHEGGFSVRRSEDGELEFRRAEGPVLRAQAAIVKGDDRAIAGAPRPAPRLASGDPLDLGLTLDCMIGLTRRRGATAQARHANGSLPS